jgi:Protein of unknown function (DUF4065)
MIQKISFPFNAQKATEVAARFILLSGGAINIMKLVKLVYLLDRESIARRGVPVVGGVYLSMRNGPVTSEILDLINAGSLWHCDTNWAEFISDRQNQEVALTRDPGAEHLSVFELELIAELFGRFEKADQWAISEWCHEHCGEWLPLDKGAEPISLTELAEEVGQPAEEILGNATEQNFLAKVFG